MDESPVVVERVTTPRGELVLRRAGTEYELISNGVFLMDTRDGRSERLLARAALEAHPHPRHALIGGLGMGFSLVEAAADRRLRRLTVVEIEPALLGWHATHLAPYSCGALADPRVDVVLADVLEHLSHTTETYDIICLDIDNAPDWTVTAGNTELYQDEGIRAVVDRLRAPGVVAVWSAHAAPDYERRLRAHLDDVRTLEVDAARGEPTVVFIARKG